MTVRCPKCQTNNPDSVKFCGECGTHLHPAKDISITKTLKNPKPFKPIAGKYEIVEKLGEGGMGLVYKAKDIRLDRTVALKFLPPEMTSNKEAKNRFIQEAKAAAALNHHHICTIYEIDEVDDQIFFSMEYVEGQSLKDKLESNPLDINEAKDVVIQVAEGLKEAHEKGIVHRDIKPANIMLTKEGQVKITDFGLAKLSWGVDLTKTSMIMGTVAYMSPEQAKGEEVDHRTDIWALGAMLYEMLTGEFPFKGTNEHAVIYAILNRKPKLASQKRKNVPREMDHIINKALAKDLNRRYASIEEILIDLKNLKDGLPIAPESVAETAELKDYSVAVVNFMNITGNPEIDWLSGGIAETVTVDLKKISVLNVVSREKVHHALKTLNETKMTEENIIDLGRILGVKWIVWGGYQKFGKAIRITTHFTETNTGNVIGSSRVDGVMDDIFKLQDKIIASLIKAFNLKVSDTEIKKIEIPETIEVEAYEYYARGRQLLLQMGKEGIHKAVEYFQKAITADPNYALAYSGLGSIYMIKYIALTKKEDLVTGISYLENAVEHDPDLADPHLWLTYALSREHRFDDAIRSGKRALKLEPDNPLSYYFIGVAYTLQGAVRYTVESFGKAIRHYQRNNDLQPNYQPAYMNAAWIHLLRGQYNEAKENLDRAVAIEESGRAGIVRFVGALTLMGNLHLRQGLFDDSFEWYQRSLVLLEKTDHVYREPFKALTYCGLGDIHFYRSQYDEAFNHYKRAHNTITKSPHALGIGYFLIQSFLGMAKTFNELGVSRESKQNFQVARDLFHSKEAFDFSWIWEGCDAQTYYEFSRYFALLNRLEETIEYLKKAAVCGWRDVPAIESDEIFAPFLKRSELMIIIENLKEQEPLP
ncbi:MAG: protein kinase [Candidatus Aminicenantes bacterium]|nr:protein kinase [Candidatus Aminicenantes bacterium]